MDTISRMRHEHAVPRHQRGLSLVELMIALTIGLVVIAAVGTIFDASKRTYRRNDGVSRAQENTRGALLLIDTVIRNAGYIPDPQYQTDPTQFFKKLTSTTYTYAVFGGTIGTSNPPSFVPTSSPTPVTGTDWVMVTYMGCALNKTVSTTDCPSATANQASSTAVQPGIGSNATVNNKGTTSVVTLRSCLGDPVPDQTISGGTNTQLAVNVFYLAKASGDTIPSLYCATQYYDGSLNAIGSAKSQAVLSGVQTMRVLYGIDYTGKNQTTQRVTAGTITTGTGGATWPMVSMVQLNLTTQNGDVVEVTSSARGQGNINSSGYLIAKTSQAISIRNRLQ